MDHNVSSNGSEFKRFCITNITNRYSMLMYVMNRTKDGYFHLPGRAELALEVQQKILPRFGFDATKDGITGPFCSLSFGLALVIFAAGVLVEVDTFDSFYPAARKALEKPGCILPEHGWPVPGCAK